MMDFFFAVGSQVALATVFNSIRIEREPELIELAARYAVLNSEYGDHTDARQKIDSSAVLRDWPSKVFSGSHVFGE